MVCVLNHPFFDTILQMVDPCPKGSRRTPTGRCSCPKGQAYHKKSKECRKYERVTRRCSPVSLSTQRKHVFYSEDPDAKAGSLYKEDLFKNKRGKVVSKRKSEASRRQYMSGNSLKRRNDLIEEMSSTQPPEPPELPEPPGPPIRKSERTSKGKTSKFKDYEVSGLKKRGKKKGSRR